MKTPGGNGLRKLRRRFWYRFSLVATVVVSVATLGVYFGAVRFSHHLLSQPLIPLTAGAVIAGFVMVSLAFAFQFAIRVRTHAFQHRVPMELSQFLNSPAFTTSVDGAFAKTFLEVLAAKLGIPSNRIYPTDKSDDLLCPLTWAESGPLIDVETVSLIFGLTGGTRHCHLEELEAVCQRIGDAPSVADVIQTLDALRSRKSSD